MQPRELIDYLGILSRMKINTRHVWTTDSRQESVADHSWRLTIMALLVAGEFPSIDTEKLLKMCLIHDFGEAVTGDIPSFLKTKQDEEKEALAIADMLERLPGKISNEFKMLFTEISERKTTEAKIFKALDNMEACISHNESPLETWLENEYTENLVYGVENAAFSEYLIILREVIKNDSLQKIENAGTQG
jgi:putative hydrolase of HD superfamily